MDGNEKAGRKLKKAPHIGKKQTIRPPKGLTLLPFITHHANADVAGHCRVEYPAGKVSWATSTQGDPAGSYNYMLPPDQGKLSSRFYPFLVQIPRCCGSSDGITPRAPDQEDA